MVVQATQGHQKDANPDVATAADFQQTTSKSEPKLSIKAKKQQPNPWAAASEAAKREACAAAGAPGQQ